MPRPRRLLDIIHSDAKLYLVFEFLDSDLKRYMDTIGDKDGLGPPMVKVSNGLERHNAGHHAQRCRHWQPRTKVQS